MMNQCYTIHHLPEELGHAPLNGPFKPEALPKPWSVLERAELSSYPWDENGYRPPCFAMVGWNARGLHVLMYAREAELRVKVHAFGGRVCCDSCMEFFVQCAPQRDGRYLNIECTSYPVMLIGLGTDRYDRAELTRIPDGMYLQASRHEGEWWAVSYTIPAAYLDATFAVTLQPGLEMRGNFYICGDETAFPHYGMWRGFDPQIIPKPDFHQPSLFGRLILAK